MSGREGRRDFYSSPSKVRPQAAGYYIPAAPPRYDDERMAVMKGETPIVYRRKKPTYIRKMHGCLRGLAIASLILAVLIVLLGGACVGVGVGFAKKCWSNWPLKSATKCPYTVINCEAGTALWQGIFAVITSSLGIAALAKSRNRCLVITYQVLLVTACVIMWGTVASSAAFTGIFAKWVERYNYGNLKNDPLIVNNQNLKDLMNSDLALTVVILVTSVIYTLLAIISAVILCYNWQNCCPDEPRKSRRDRAPSAIYASPAMFAPPPAPPRNEPLAYHSPVPMQESPSSQRKPIRYYY